MLLQELNYGLIFCAMFHQLSQLHQQFHPHFALKQISSFQQQPTYSVHTASLQSLKVFKISHYNWLRKIHYRTRFAYKCMITTCRDNCIGCTPGLCQKYCYQHLLKQIQYIQIQNSMTQKNFPTAVAIQLHIFLQPSS